MIDENNVRKVIQEVKAKYWEETTGRTNIVCQKLCEDLLERLEL